MNSSRRITLDRLEEADVADLCAKAFANGGPVIVALPKLFEGIDCARLAKLKGVAGTVWPRREDVPSGAPAEHAGYILVPSTDWVLPIIKSSHLLFLGPRRSLTAIMLKTAFMAGVRRVTYGRPSGWRTKSISRLIGERVRDRGIRHLVRLAPPMLSALEIRQERAFDAFIKAAREGAAGKAREFPPRRILFMNNSLSVGGAERQIVNTMVGLKARGFDDISLLCEWRPDFYGSDVFIRQLASHRITIEELPNLPPREPSTEVGRLLERPRLGLNRWPQMLLDDVLFCIEVLLQRRPSVLHAWQDATAVTAGLAGIAAGIPRIVLSTRTISPVHFSHWHPWLRPAYRALARQPEVTLVNNSEAGAIDYAGWLGVPADRFHVVRNGLGDDALRPADQKAVADFRARHAISPGLRVVGSMYRFCDEKNPELWLRAAAEILRRKSETRFLLVGSGPLGPRMERTAKELGIEKQVIFPGEMSDPRPALAVMDVFLLTSRVEGLPNVLIEAQAQGVPVVTTAAGGAAEAIDPGHTGFVVTGADPVQLADAALRILDDPVWAGAAREQGPSFAAARFGLQPMVDSTLRLYGLKTD